MPTIKSFPYQQLRCGGVYKEVFVTRAAQQLMESTAQEPNADMIKYRNQYLPPTSEMIIMSVWYSIINKNIRGRHSSKDSNCNCKTTALFPATTRHWVLLFLPVLCMTKRGIINPRELLHPFSRIYMKTHTRGHQKDAYHVWVRAPGEAHSPFQG